MLAVVSPLINAFYYEPWEVYGCASLDDIPCDLARPFCTKVYLAEDGQWGSSWADGLHVYDICALHYWRGRECRAYMYQYGRMHPNSSNIADLINETCFSNSGFDAGFGDGGFGGFGGGGFGGDTTPEDSDEDEDSDDQGEDEDEYSAAYKKRWGIP